MSAEDVAFRPFRRGLRLVLATVAACAALLMVAPACASAAVAPVAQDGPAATVDTAANGDTAAAQLETVPLSSLPPEATDTVELIRAGGPFPYEQDGTTFQNREGLLPPQPGGYYKEYTVPTPGSDDRGARRIVTGSGGEYFYTADHYDSFVAVDVNR